MAAYLSLAQFKARSKMPSVFIDQIEASEPGWTDLQLEMESGRLDARLRKRYAAPFGGQHALVIDVWLVAIVTMSAWLRRGFSPTDLEAQVYVDDLKTALDEIKEAANSETGLFDLPLNTDATSASAISKGGPRSCSQVSPYVWRQEQAARGKWEDSLYTGYGCKDEDP
jgi:hypothetical protein